MPAIMHALNTAVDVVCPICRHEWQRRELTRHHLVPKCRKGKITVLLCRNCHRQVHALFSEKVLERRYGTLDLLLEAEELQPWITWVRRRKPAGRVAVRTSRRRR